MEQSGQLGDACERGVRLQPRRMMRRQHRRNLKLFADATFKRGLWAGVLVDREQLWTLVAEDNGRRRDEGGGWGGRWGVGEGFVRRRKPGRQRVADLLAFDGNWGDFSRENSSFLSSGPTGLSSISHDSARLAVKELRRQGKTKERQKTTKDDKEKQTREGVARKRGKDKMRQVTGEGAGVAATWLRTANSSHWARVMPN